VLSSKNGKGDFYTTSYENTINPCPLHISELKGRLNNWESFCPFHYCLSKSSLINGPSYNRFTNPMGHDKWFGLEERLRVVEGNNLIHHVIAVEDCLVLNIMVSKEFRALDFVKYTRLECPYTHLRSFYNKMAKMIHNDKMLIYFFQDSLTGSVLSWYMRLDNIKINI
jgi:hypothetical protein